MNISEAIIDDGRQYWAINESIRAINFEFLYMEVKRRIRKDVDGFIYRSQKQDVHES